MPVIDNMMLGAPDQPGERLVDRALSPGASRRREAEVRDEAMELLEIFNLDQAQRITPARYRGVSGSCSSSRGR